ncbi:MAG TPA: hypothetical protein VKJ01_02155 [Candidatus Solibacter sp.]|nr:hypothetical protein [Candidatus Solibacter sp.]
MNEVAMALWAMTASHHQWPIPPKEPVAVVRMVEAGKPALNPDEQARLRAALDRMARCTTGRLMYDQASGFYLPEPKANCK